MQKIMSMILSLTIVLGLVTPAYATDTSGIDDGNEQIIKLEDIIDTDNVQLESDYEISDLEEEELFDAIENSNTDYSQNTENTDIFINEDKNNEEQEKPSYSVDEEMEKYFEDYLKSLNRDENNTHNEEISNESDAEEGVDDVEEIAADMKYEDGLYYIDYSINEIDSTNLSTYIDSDKSRIQILDGKIKVYLAINEAEAIADVRVKVNEKSVAVKRKDITNTSYIVEFIINSLSDDINLTFDCDYSTIFNEMGIQSHEIDFIINNIELAEQEIETTALDESIEELKDGIYSVDYSVYKDGTFVESTLKKYIKDATLRAEKNKKKLILNIDNSSGMIGNLTVKVNSNRSEVNTLEKDSIITMEFEIESVEDEISIGMSVTTPMMVMNHNVDFVINAIKFVEELPKTGGEELPEEGQEELNDGTYTIESKFLKDNSNSEESAAGNYLNSKSTLTVKDGKYTLTINVKSYADAFSDLSATVDDVTTKDVEFIKNSDGTGSISFSINSLSSSISVGFTLYIASINYTNTTSFDVKLDKSTIKDENGNEVEAPAEDILNMNKDAVYTISNKVIGGENGSIPESARYLDTSSSVEVKYGNIFVTLVFNMTGFMDGRSITLNDNQSAATAAVKNQDNKTYVSFMITSISDEIHVSSKSTRSIDDGFTVVFDINTLVVDNNGSSYGNNQTPTPTPIPDPDDGDDDLDNGTYTIKNKVLKEDSDSESHAREYVDKESVITVKNNKMYLTLKFVKASVIKGVSIKVDGTKTSYSTVKKTSDKLYIKFRIDSLSDEILVTTDLDLSNYGIASHDGLAFRVLLRSSTLEEDDDADNYDDEKDNDEEDDETVTDTVINETEEVKDSQQDLMNGSVVDINDSYKKTTYKVKNDIVTDSAFGYQAARGAVNEVGYYEIIDDKKYITLGFRQTDIMNNIRLSINGKQINYDIISQDKSKNTLEIRFEVPSVTTMVTVTTNVTAMGRDISFGVQFLESTLELISVEESDNLSDLTGTSSNISLNGTSDSSSGSFISKITNAFSSSKTGEGEVIADEEAAESLASLAKEYFKKYTVTNEIISDSAIGRSMARKYLNQTSIIEDIDGQLYATITFSSASSMGDFRIEVNGQTVSHTVPLNDMSNNLVSLRFPINSVNDDIRAYIYINVMRINIDFGIKFLEDSMILIEEGTVGGEQDTESSSLMDTLSDLNESSQNNKEQISAVKIAASTSVMMIILNQILSGLGIMFKRFKAKSLLKKIS